MSTTDPIAVLMVLHEIGAPVRLKALVGGESLLNDGTSIIIVTLFLQLQEGVVYSGGDIVAFIFRELFVGPLFGIVMGYATLVCMRSLEEHAVPLVTLSFAVPFVTFIITSTYFKSSGVLAIVAMGLLINRFGKAFLNRHLEHVESFWSQVEHFSTCLLYTQSGLYVAQDLMLGGIDSVDWGSLFGLFAWITLVRAMMILLSYPLLQRMGYGLNWREAVVMVHGGLRGAVSILLSFTIAGSPAVGDRASSLTLFFISGIVLLMCFNVITTGPLCRALGLQFDKSQPVYTTLRRILEESTLFTLNSTGIVDSAKVWREVTSAPVELCSPVLKESLVEKRYHLNLGFKQTFETLLETRLINRPAWFSLLMSVEPLIDEHVRSPEERLMTWDLVEKRLELWKLKTRCSSHEEYLAVRSLLNDKFESNIATFENTYNATVKHFTYCAFALLVAHERSRKIMRETFFEDKEHLQLLLDESLEACRKPARFINRVFVTFPAIIGKIKRHHARTQVNRQNLGILRGMKRRGILNEAVLKQLCNSIEHMNQSVEKIDFDLHEPLSIGVYGEGLSANPNFGPFRKSQSSLLHQQLSRQGSLVSNHGLEHDLVDPAIAESQKPEEATKEEEYLEKLINENQFPAMEEVLDRLEAEQQVEHQVEPELKV